MTQQVYHANANANTNINIRTQIQNSFNTNSDLALRFNTSQQTISKWKNRTFTQDKACEPLNIKYALTEIEKTLIISLRKSSWLSLDEVWETILEKNPNISIISVYRTFVAEKTNKVPQQQKGKVSEFKQYDPVYLHIDVNIYQSYMANRIIFLKQPKIPKILWIDVLLFSRFK